MTRQFMIKAEPLREGFMLGLREQFASAVVDDAEILWDHGFGFGHASISMTIAFPDGDHVTETFTLNELMQKWAKAVLKEHKEGESNG